MCPRRAKAPAPVCAEFARAQAGPGRLRAGHVHQRGGRAHSRPRRPRSRRCASAAPARAARRAARQAQGPGPRPPGAAAARLDQARSFAASRADPAAAALQYGLDSVPALNNPRLRAAAGVRASDRLRRSRSRGSPTSSRTRTTALIQARLRPGLSAVRAQSRDRRWCARPSRAPRSGCKFGSYVVTGDPVLREAVASDLPHEAAVVLVAAVLLIAVVARARVRAPRCRCCRCSWRAARDGASRSGIARLAGGIAHACDALRCSPVLIGLSTGLRQLLARRRTAGREAPRLATAGVLDGRRAGGAARCRPSP